MQYIHRQVEEIKSQGNVYDIYYCVTQKSLEKIACIIEYFSGEWSSGIYCDRRSFWNCVYNNLISSSECNIRHIRKHHGLLNHLTQMMCFIIELSKSLQKEEEENNYNNLLNNKLFFGDELCFESVNNVARFIADKTCLHKFQNEMSRVNHDVTMEIFSNDENQCENFRAIIIGMNNDPLPIGIEIVDYNGMILCIINIMKSDYNRIECNKLSQRANKMIFATCNNAISEGMFWLLPRKFKTDYLHSDDRGSNQTLQGSEKDISVLNIDDIHRSRDLMDYFEEHVSHQYDNSSYVGMENIDDNMNNYLQTEINRSRHAIESLDDITMFTRQTSSKSLYFTDSYDYSFNLSYSIHS